MLTIGTLIPFVQRKHHFNDTNTWMVITSFVIIIHFDCCLLKTQRLFITDRLCRYCYEASFIKTILNHVNCTGGLVVSMFIINALP